MYSAPINYSISDHFPVFAVYKIKNNDHNKSEGRHKTITYRKYTTFALLLDLQNTSWLPLRAANVSTVEYLQIFLCTFTKTIDKHLPLVTKRIKKTKQPDWINNRISLAISKRGNAKKNTDEHNYKHWRNETTRLIRDAKKT